MNTISSDIAASATSLGVLAGRVEREQWEYLSILRRQLYALADQVAHMEKALILDWAGTRRGAKEQNNG